MAELRKLIEHCKFQADTLEEMLHDRLVVGINDDQIQRRLLAESKLTFKKPLEIAHGMETAAQNARDIQRAGNASSENVQMLKNSHRNDKTSNKGQRGPASHPTHIVNKTWTQAQHTNANQKPCYRCGGTTHGHWQCKFKDATCSYCKKKGHIVKVCYSKCKQKKPVHYVDSADNLFTEDQHVQKEDSTEPYFLFQLSDEREQPIKVTSEVNNTPLDWEVDTCASLTVMGAQTFEELSEKSNQSLILEKSYALLKTYTGESIPVKGVVKVDLSYNNKQYKGMPGWDISNWIGKRFAEWLTKVTRFYWIYIKKFLTRH